MLSNYTIEQKSSVLSSISDHEEKLYEVLNVLINTFPVKNAHLFRYSPLGFIGEGIIALDSFGITHIREIRDDIRNLPIIHNAIYTRKAKFKTGIDFFKGIKSNYIFPQKFHSLLVIPIFIDSFVIGYIGCSEFEEGFKPTEKLLQTATYYGENVGRAFIEINSKNKDTILSRRELEAMKYVAIGQTTKEMANYMNISESTARQYVKTAITKLNAKNRSHAITILFQKGIIT